MTGPELTTRRQPAVLSHLSLLTGKVGPQFLLKFLTGAAGESHLNFVFQ
jgi:hypothetical protein